MSLGRSLGAVVVLLAALTASDARTQDQSTTYAIWGDPAKGRRVYAAKGCGRCHAINGVGPTIGPDLGRAPARSQTITQIAASMWNHAPEMRKLAQEKGVQWTPFKGSELRDVVAYLHFLRLLDQPGDPARGERLFDEKRCSACHAIGGRGGRIASDLSRWKQYGSPILWAEIMWQHAGQMETTMRELGMPWPEFRGNEMGDLIAFVRSRAAVR